MIVGVGVLGGRQAGMHGRRVRYRHTGIVELFWLCRVSKDVCVVLDAMDMDMDMVGFVVIPERKGLAAA
jgi:hypothetical protein